MVHPPWEVARLSWESQRRMAFLLFRTDSSQEQPRQEVISDGGPSLRQVIEKNAVAAVGNLYPRRLRQQASQRAREQLGNPTSKATPSRQKEQEI
jgi:hypothetical protein